MVQIATYFRHGEDFVPVDAFVGPIPDEDYIEGAMELSIDGRAMLTRQEWDYIDQLWAYLVGGVADLLGGRKFQTFFPDQPIELSVTPDEVGGRATVRVVIREDVREASAELTVLVAEVLKEARHFFERIQKVVPREAYEQTLEEISTLEQSLRASTRAHQPGVTR
ncbi:MAG: hypothetical protein EOO72_06085 [Myxococcaceae bacterium]|uniref:Uncharacterized protein n=1 Tax=Corallococcus coralloides TaxID=184914 RepID=A0A410S416_CORCK|nr:hypothetical protein [Corallococcus coralloides]QAT88937.1 hypothetical protein EJ065_7414 [Corallococcus coralloides]RYZ44470.1 MAG: hypothetical protein EOO72_06085 [Myxococcaceae bacterium]